jgi:hypothetical protein
LTSDASGCLVSAAGADLEHVAQPPPGPRDSVIRATMYGRESSPMPTGSGVFS